MRALKLNTVIILLVLPVLTLADGIPSDIDNISETGPQQSIKSRTVTTAIRSQPTNQLLPSPRSVQVYASDKTAEVSYEKSGPVLNLNNSRASASLLFNEKRDNVLSGSLMYDAEPEFFPGLTLSFGSKLFAGLLGIENADIVGLAATIQAAYMLPVRQFPLQLSASASYAPDILTFGQADRIIDWNVRTGLSLTNNIDGFVGLRFLQFDTQPGDRKLDKKVHIGIRWKLDN